MLPQVCWSLTLDWWANACHTSFLAWYISHVVCKVYIQAASHFQQVDESLAKVEIINVGSLHPILLEKGIQPAEQ